jgi:hypothetical protein
LIIGVIDIASIGVECPGHLVRTHRVERRSMMLAADAAPFVPRQHVAEQRVRKVPPFAVVVRPGQRGRQAALIERVNLRCVQQLDLVP